MKPSQLGRAAPSENLKYSDLFMRLSDAGFLVDPTTLKILETNAAAEGIFFSHEERNVNAPLERSILDFIPVEEHDQFQKAIRMSLRRYHPRTFELHFKGDKQYLMEVMACPLKSVRDETDDESTAENPIMQIILRDITQKKEDERLLAEALEQLKKLSITDAMTGLFNFRHFQERLKLEHTRSLRYKTPYSVIFCDLDNFKFYNDKHGHPAGDELLRQLAGVLQKSIRDTDSVFRYGGEEFVIICPQSDAKGATIAAERIRKAIQNTAFSFAKEQPLGFISMSMGVASFPEHGNEAELITQAADSEVYKSKHAGRNRVSTATSEAHKKSA